MSLEDLRQMADSDNAQIALALAGYAGGLLALLLGNAAVQKIIEGAPRRRRVREARKLEKYETSA